MFATAAERAAGDGFNAATWTPGMGDVPRPHGLFSAALGDAWPTESESALKDTAGGRKRRAERHADAASAAKANTDKVFSSDWTDGAGAEAAYAHYQSEHEAHHALHTALDSAGAGTARIADSVGSAKVKMRTAHDDAHREIEEALRATPAGGIVNVAPILAKYRGQIHSYATELHGIVGDELSLFGASHNVPPLAPSGTGSDGMGQSTDGNDSRKPDKSTSHAGKEDQSESGGSTAGDKGSPSQPGQAGSSHNPDQSTGSSKRSRQSSVNPRPRPAPTLLMHRPAVQLETRRPQRATHSRWPHPRPLAPWGGHPMLPAPLAQRNQLSRKCPRCRPPEVELQFTAQWRGEQRRGVH